MATPSPILIDLSNSNKEGGRSQNLILFNRGYLISVAPLIRGSRMFPNPPIIVGITMKKIIMNAWAVTTEL